MASDKITLYKEKTDTTPGTHPGNPTEMNVPLQQLDKVGIYLNDKLITCAGTVSWDGTTLTWDGAITIRFAGEDGKTYENTIAAGSKAIADGDFAYVTLNEAATGPLTVATATPTVDAKCNFLDDEVLVLGWRVGSKFSPIALCGEYGAGTSSGGIFDPSLFYPGTPDDSAVMLYIPITRACTFAADFAGSYLIAGTAATAQSVFRIKKNGTEVGTITVAASGSSGAFASSGGASVSFAAGEVLSIVAPSTADATLADIGIALAGARA